MMHNHGPEEGPGLGCNEVKLPDGTVKGACLPPDELNAMAYRLAWQVLTEGEQDLILRFARREIKHRE